MDASALLQRAEFDFANALRLRAGCGPREDSTTHRLSAIVLTGLNIANEGTMPPHLGPAGEVDDYIAACPMETQLILQKIRATVRDCVPEATEKISYKMPTFCLGRVIVHYGAFKNHIGLFPPVRNPNLVSQTLSYRGEKGNLKFPLDQPIPYDLIGKIVQARVGEIREKQARKPKDAGELS
jgi:uncharacterized protein YdhG (YjbR/CyaY superfamily)